MMSRSVKVVIGANFGDEGKGVAVDALAACLGKAIVVRFNGGAQAGHTVSMPDGRRHVFSHVGAGALAHAPTFLSRFFVVHPSVFARELAELATLGVKAKVYVDPDAQVTTPYDILINRWIEEQRATGRHGSVGVGFGETIERKEKGISFAVRDLGDDDRMVDTLAKLRHDWLPMRLARLGIEYSAERERTASAPGLIERYLDDIRFFRQGTIPASIDMAVRGRQVIFEGAQGLLLDQDRGRCFPHVTRSNTGVRNVLVLAKELGIETLDVAYMTRSYLTRHGAGPLPNETARLSFVEVIDLTNRPNPWQGSLRLAPLDLDLLRATVDADTSDGPASGIAIEARIGVTCLDQICGAAEVRAGGSVLQVAANRLTSTIAEFIGVVPALEAWGPSRATVRFAPASHRQARPRADTRWRGSTTSAPAWRESAAGCAGAC